MKDNANIMFKKVKFTAVFLPCLLFLGLPLGLLSGCLFNEETIRSAIVLPKIEEIAKKPKSIKPARTVAKGNVTKITNFSERAKYVVVDREPPRISQPRTKKIGGGSYKIGGQYFIKGKKYVPHRTPKYDKVGIASWYGPYFHGRRTANGEIYDQYGITAAHTTFPLPSYAHVTNLENNRSIVVRVNDRGPFHGNRIIDLSAGVAELLNMKRKGTAKVRVRYLSEAPLHGRDERYLMSTYQEGNERFASLLNPPKKTSAVLASIDVENIPIPVKRPTLDEADRRAFNEASTEDSIFAEIGNFNDSDDLDFSQDNGSTLALRLRLLIEKNSVNLE